MAPFNRLHMGFCNPLLAFRSNYGAILYRLRDKQVIGSKMKITKFLYPASI